MSKKIDPRIREFLLLNAGTLLVAVGVYFFKFPNHFTTGGVTGIAIVASYFFPSLSTSSMTFLLNMALLLVGFLFLGRSFGIKTVYSSILFSLALSGLEWLVPMNAPFTDEPLLELIFTVALPACGSAILFNIDASTGGTDIVAMLLKKYTSLDIGKSLMFVDSVVAVAACFVFGMKTGLFSILGLMMKSLLIDTVIESINQHKYMHIVCTQPQAICHFIVKELHRGATVLDANGAYTHHQLSIIMTAMSRSQALKLRRFVRQVDPHAFIMITNTSEIIGNGFKGGN